jgi:hypothetical protein
VEQEMKGAAARVGEGGGCERAIKKTARELPFWTLMMVKGRFDQQECWDFCYKLADL